MKGLVITIVVLLAMVVFLLLDISERTRWGETYLRLIKDLLHDIKRENESTKNNDYGREKEND